MHDNDVTKLPASWVEGLRETTPNDAAVEGTNGKPHVHGLSNGHTAEQHNAGQQQQQHEQTPPPLLQEDSVLPPEFLEGKAVRTVYGAVPLRDALDWPVFASYDELAGCAAWMGGRIPTLEEARSIYAHAAEQRARRRRQRADAENRLGRTVPAVNA